MSNELPLFWQTEFAEFHDLVSHEIENDMGLSLRLVYDEFEDTIRIPGRLTFGGFCTLDMSPIDSRHNIKEYYENLKSNKLQIKLPPHYFHPEIFETQADFLLKFGKNIVTDVNHHVDVNLWNLEMMSKGNIKKYNQCVRNGMTFNRAKQENLHDVVKLLVRNREEKGLTMSMTYTEIRDSFLALPHAYNAYLVRFGEVIVAAAITVEISKESTYVLYWGDNSEFRKFSPVVFLFVNLLENAKIDMKTYLDLGISSVSGTLNPGLSNFKTNLGANKSLKYSGTIPTY